MLREQLKQKTKYDFGVEMTTEQELLIVKRDGHTEPLDLNKIHKMTEAACDGLSGTSASEVEMNSGLQFTNKMTTVEIQNILIKHIYLLIIKV